MTLSSSFVAVSCSALARETDGVSLGPEAQGASIVDLLNASGALEYGV